MIYIYKILAKSTAKCNKCNSAKKESHWRTKTPGEQRFGLVRLRVIKQKDLHCGMEQNKQVVALTERIGYTVRIMFEYLVVQSLNFTFDIFHNPPTNLLYIVGGY